MSHKNEIRVVITGIGAICGLGNNVAEYWQNIVAGKSGVTHLKYRTLVGMVDSLFSYVKPENIDITDIAPVKERKNIEKFSQLGIHAAYEAIKQAGLLGMDDNEKAGVLLGCGAGGMNLFENQTKRSIDIGTHRVSPHFLSGFLINMPAANISKYFRLTGYTNTTSTACAAGTQAISEALYIIKRGVADIIVTGGCESSLSAVGLGGFKTARAITKWDVADPTKASRPFDAKRSGFIPSEGAGILIVESLEHAEKRGAKPLAELIGGGVSSDAYHLVQPHPNGIGAYNSMKWALESANVGTDEVDYINAHGTSTPLNDKTETDAVKMLFGKRAYDIPISSTKSMIGHAFGASGGLEAVACVQTIQNDVIHPTINQEFPDPDCDLNYVPNKAIDKKVDIILSNSFGFGGQNASIVLKRFED